jgi:hypothetical protein
MNNVRIVGFVGDSPPSGTRSLDITGRLLFSPAIPDNYPPPNQGDKTTIKCRWRFKGQAEWTDWTLDDITLGEVCDDPPPGTTHLPGVHYRYFSFNPVFTDEGIYQFEFFYDADRDGEKDDAEEGIRSAYLLTRLSVYQESNPSNRIFNRTPKDPHDVQTNILYVVADPDQHVNVTVHLSQLSGSHGTPIRCAVFHGTTHKMISNDASFDSTGCAKLNINHPGSPDPVDLNIYIGCDTDGDSALDWTEAMILPVVGENLSYIDPRAAVIRASSVSKYNSDSRACRWLTIPLTKVTLPCAARLFELFVYHDPNAIATLYAPSLPRPVMWLDMEAFRIYDFSHPISESCYSEWLTHNAGARFGSSDSADIPLYYWLPSTVYGDMLAEADPLNPLRRSPPDALIDFYIGTVIPEACYHYKNDPTDYDTFEYVSPFFLLIDRSPASRDMSVDVGSFSSIDQTQWDAKASFGRARVISVERNFYIERISATRCKLARMTVTAHVEDLYDFCFDDVAGIPQVGVTAGKFATLQLAFGKGAYPSRDFGNIFLFGVFSHKTFIVSSSHTQYPDFFIVP